MSNSIDDEWEKPEIDANGAEANANDSEFTIIKLEKDLPDQYINGRHGSEFYVLPAGGMQVAYPDLAFHANHFGEKSNAMESKDFEVVSDEQVNNFERIPGNVNNGNSQKVFTKLPFGLELTAGRGSAKSSVDQSKRSMPPSETLLASAAFLKSYFTPSFESKESKEEASASDTEDSVKDKFIGIWHNLKYGWSTNLKTNFSRETPVYMLGKVYHKCFDQEKRHQEDNIEGFRLDFSNLGWFTYRRKFAPLPESTLTTDCGWGCMIRSGQMMMNTALNRHFLPERQNTGVAESHMRWSLRQRIVKLFCDDPSPRCPFSIHNLIRHGLKWDKHAGNWYGPSCVAHMFKVAFEEGSKHIPELDRLGIYVAQDGAVYIQDVLDMCSVGKCICRKPPNDPPSRGKPRHCYSEAQEALESVQEFENSLDSQSSSKNKRTSDDFEVLENSEPPLDHFVNRITSSCDVNKRLYSGSFTGPSENNSNERLSNSEADVCSVCQGWKSCVILIPVRLGGTSLNPIYNNCIYSLFLHDLCIGIIGGRPKHSLYFVGFQDTSLINLDPHFCQDAVAPDAPDFPMNTYLSNSPRKIRISRIDPSATIGFYCHTRTQFFRLIQEASFIANANDGKLDSPIFEFVNGRNQDLNGWVDFERGSNGASNGAAPIGPMSSSMNSLSTSLCDDIEELSFDA